MIFEPLTSSNDIIDYINELLFEASGKEPTAHETYSGLMIFQQEWDANDNIPEYLKLLLDSAIKKTSVKVALDLITNHPSK